MGGLQAKLMTSQRYRATYKMADMCYYGNVMTTTRWRLYVTMETLWQQQDGGYALLCKRYPNNQITSTFAVEDVYTELVIDIFYTGCHRRKGPNFGRVFLMLNYTDITQNTYIQS